MEYLETPMEAKHLEWLYFIIDFIPFYVCSRSFSFIIHKQISILLQVARLCVPLFYINFFVKFLWNDVCLNLRVKWELVYFITNISLSTCCLNSRQILPDLKVPQTQRLAHYFKRPQINIFLQLFRFKEPSFLNLTLISNIKICIQQAFRCVSVFGL